MVQWLAWTLAPDALAADEAAGWQEACVAATGDPEARVALTRTADGWDVSCAAARVHVRALPTDPRARTELLWIALARERTGTRRLGPPPPVPRAAPRSATPAPAPPAAREIPSERLPALPPARPSEPTLPLRTMPVPPPPAAPPTRWRPAVSVGGAVFPIPAGRFWTAIGAVRGRWSGNLLFAHSGKLYTGLPSSQSYWWSVGAEAGLHVQARRLGLSIHGGVAVRPFYGFTQQVDVLTTLSVSPDYRFGRWLLLGVRADLDLPTSTYEARSRATWTDVTTVTEWVFPANLSLTVGVSPPEPR